MARILVTGSTGFIGRRLMAHLRAAHPSAGISLFVKPAVTPAEAAALQRYEQAGFTMIRGDLSGVPVTTTAPPDVDLIYHLAANIDTAATEDECRVNDLGTIRLIEWLGPKARGARLVFTSTVAVCDPVGPDAGPVDETSACAPRTAYGRTKLWAESAIRERAATAGFTYTILRLPTVYGAGQKPGGMFDLLMHAAERDALVARLNWPGRTSVVYIEDVARLLVEIGVSAAAENTTVCVANGESMSIGEIARRLAVLSGHPVKPIDLPAALWRIGRLVTYVDRLAQWLPRPLYQAYWRLSLVIGDGFLQSDRKLKAIAPTAVMLPLQDGVTQMLAAMAQVSDTSPR